MRTFLLANIVSYASVLIYVLSINKWILSLSMIKTSITTYALLNIGAFLSFINIFCIKNSKCLLSFILWIFWILFAIYTYRYTNNNTYLWILLSLLWLLLGSQNPILN